jgi:hypothetical protein
MSRKKIPRRIPPLPKQAAFREKDHKAEQLLALLRNVASSVQGAEPQLFYPYRDVAEGYRVPVSMVGKVYRELEQEGVLRRIRGSGTVLQGLNPTRKLTVRGIIAIASSLSCFLTLQDYRTFLMQIRRELRKRDFAAAEVFFEGGDSADVSPTASKIVIPIRWFGIAPTQFPKNLPCVWLIEEFRLSA